MLTAVEERRRRTRFPINLEVRYTVPGRRRGQAGLGHTLNISSRGVLMTADHSLSPGTPVQLSIDWPVHLNRQCSLALHVGGKVVRSDSGQTAVQFRSYELRTRPNHRPG